nr:exodeoxyribonuclease V subunit gamma [Desulfonema ishimotonii]
MKRFHLFTGNRMEKLVGMLGDVLSAPPASPTTSDVVVVQSKGMERWPAGTASVPISGFPFPTHLCTMISSRNFSRTCPKYPPLLLRLWFFMA